MDEALGKSDQRAQGEAWGSALRRGAVNGEGKKGAKRVGWVDVLVWRIRGAMYCLGMGLSWGQGLIGELVNSPLAFHGTLPNGHFQLASRQLVSRA